MTSDHSIPYCLRCPDTALRLIDRGAFAVSPDVTPFPTAIRDSTLTAEVWVCPVCRRMELRYPAELPLPETAEEQQARRLELRMNQYPADRLRHIAADPALTEEERAAAARVLSRRQG
mgnify:CR=1 FL=1